MTRNDPIKKVSRHPTMNTWLVRIYRYDGTDSTLATGLSEEAAVEKADHLNTATQSTQYRAEQYDSNKADAFWDDVCSVLASIPGP